jgi:hypothetical protein
MKYLLKSLCLASLIGLSAAAAYALTGVSQSSTFQLTITPPPPPPPNGGACGGLLGQVATDTATAGFDTCVLYNDFTTAIPNSVGTGLPSNWLNCNPGTDTDAVWNASGYGVPCSSFQQVTDVGGGGNLALDLHYNVASMTNTCIYCNNAQLVTAAWGTPTANPNAHSWSNGYFEITYRTDGNFPGSQQAWWSWTCCGTGNTFVEQDFLEDWGTAGAAVDSAYDWWVNGNGVGFGNVQPHYPSHDATTYHTLGAMITGNLSNFSVCTYYDGSAVGCTNQNYLSGQDGTQRRQLWMQNGIGCNNDPSDSTCVPADFTDSHMYVQSVKAVTCAAEPAGGSCLGNTYNGSFYQP